jgi:hypothetical protein
LAKTTLSFLPLDEVLTCRTHRLLEKIKKVINSSQSFKIKL